MVWRPREYWIGKYAFPAVVWSLTNCGVVMVRAVTCPETGRIRLRLDVDILKVQFGFTLAVVEDVALSQCNECS